MIRKALIALAAVTAAGLALAPAADAKTRINFDVGINLGGGGIYVGPGAGFYDDDFVMVSDEPDCGWEMVRHKKWNASHTRKVVFFTKQYVCG